MHALTLHPVFYNYNTIVTLLKQLMVFITVNSLLYNRPFQTHNITNNSTSHNSYRCNSFASGPMSCI